MSYVRITQRELDSLREKERAHDAYLAACKIMAVRQYRMLSSLPMTGVEAARQQGWLDCLREFNQAVVDGNHVDADADK